MILRKGLFKTTMKGREICFRYSDICSFFNPIFRYFLFYSQILRYFSFLTLKQSVTELYMIKYCLTMMSKCLLSTAIHHHSLSLSKRSGLSLQQDLSGLYLGISLECKCICRARQLLAARQKETTANAGNSIVS